MSSLLRRPYVARSVTAANDTRAVRPCQPEGSEGGRKQNRPGVWAQRATTLGPAMSGRRRLPAQSAGAAVGVDPVLLHQKILPAEIHVGGGAVRRGVRR